MREKTIVDVLHAHTRATMQGVHVAIPGRVSAYDVNTQTADIEAAIKMPHHIGEDGLEVGYEALPTFPAVPVAFLRGGGFFVALPMAAGDPVMLLFSEAAFGEYLTTGEISKPLDARKHSYGYPIAIPGGAAPEPKKLADAPIDGVVVGKDGSDLQIKVTELMITLGKGAADFVALGPAVDGKLKEMRTELNKVIAYVNGLAPGTAIPITPVTGVLATLVKAK